MTIVLGLEEWLKWQSVCFVTMKHLSSKCVGLEFKPQYHQKKTKKRERENYIFI
jgi:hypothetical protein